MTEEHKRKIGAANKLRLKGKKHSAETRKKMSEAHRRNPSRHMLGRKTSETTNQKRSLSLKAHYDKVGRQTPEQRRAKEKAYWEANKAKKKAKDARYYAAHKAKFAAYSAKKHAANPKAAIERVNLWRAANRAHANTISANRRARIAGAEGSHTVGEWENLKQQYGYRCNGCGKTEPEIKLTRDHIIPIARGGSNYIENIQPLCGKCNCRKHAKMPNEISKEV